MLELRPTCEHCGKPLPPESTEAMICTFECTFCATCVKEVLYGVCQNCGGNFQPRPIRPSKNWKGDNYTGKYPPGTRVVRARVDADAHRAFAATFDGIPPEKR